jgi:hypothetical protein
MMRMHYLLLFCLVALGLFSSCSSDRLDISVPSTQVSISYSRLDLDLGNAKNQKEISEVNKRYLDCCPDMYTFYVRGCLQAGNPEDSLIAEALMQFVQDEYMKKVHQGLKDGFPNLQDNQDRIDNAFRYLKHYFPSGKQPERILFYNSAFTNSVVSSDSEIGVGLERYLGKEHPVIKDLPEQYFYQYIKEKMDVRYLERDIIMSWISANYLGEIDEQGTVAEQLIAWGKLVYLTEGSLPKLDKSTLLRYTESEYEWAEKNEEAFWKFLIEENVLFKREHKFAQNIFQEGPFTPGLPIEEKSSPRLGIYLGWKIVKNYMNNTPETSVHDLLDTDYKQILRTYKGK